MILLTTKEMIFKTVKQIVEGATFGILCVVIIAMLVVLS